MTKNGKIDFAQDAFFRVLGSQGSRFSFRLASQAIKGSLSGSIRVFFWNSIVAESPFSPSQAKSTLKFTRSPTSKGTIYV